MSNCCPVLDSYAKISALSAEVPALKTKIPGFYDNVCIFGFRCVGNVCGQVLICHIHFVSNDGVRTMHGSGGGGGGSHFVGENARVCAQNYSGAWFIAPIWGPIPNHNPDHSTAGECKGDIRGSCRSRTSWPWSQSGRWPIQVRVKWVPPVFIPCVDSNSRECLVPPSWWFNALRGKT